MRVNRVFKTLPQKSHRFGSDVLRGALAKALIGFSILLGHAHVLPAQEAPPRVESQDAGQQGAPAERERAEDVVRVNTRVVFIDTLVKDKRTGAPVAGLTRDNFRVLDNGKPRALSYFSREGDARRPLALVLCLNFDYTGARRYLEREDVRASLAAALAKLAPEDEVAVIGVWEPLGGKPVMLADLTRDRAKAIAALTPPPDAAAASMSGQGVAVMNEAAQKALDIARRERPNSQVVFVHISDGAATDDLIDFSDRRKLAAKLIEGGVIFTALTCDMIKGLAVAAAVLNVPLRMLGASLTGAEKYLAKQTGGVPVRVKKPEEFGAGLQQITGDLASRYSLGFTLGEDEHDDGQIRQLDVKVKARDARGRERKLAVSARRGYYPPAKTK